MESEINCCFSAPALNNSLRELEAEKNDIAPIENQCLTQKTVPKLMDLYPVSPFSIGAGPPYAPEDWPRPGDKWTWRVGKKISTSGMFHQRYLYPPPHFRRPDNGRGYFAVRSRLENYIRKVFPDKNFDAFFASFSWNIPAKNFYRSKAQTPPCPSNKPRKMKEHENDDDEEESDDDDEEEWVEKPTDTRKRKREPAPTTIYRRKTRHSFKCRFPSNVKKQHIFIDLTQEPESGPDSSSSKDNNDKNSNPENDQVPSHQNPVSLIGTSHSHGSNLQESMDDHQDPFETNSEDPDFSIIYPSENKVDAAHKKLASLLAIDFSNSITTENLAELTNVLSVIKEDPRLPLDQLLKLHRLEEIPLLGRCFHEASQEMEHDKGCTSVVPNIAKTVSLVHRYNQCKDRATKMQAEIVASLSAKKELEEEITKLQTQHAQLVCDIGCKIIVKNEILSTRRSVAESITNMMGKIVIGALKTHELETRKVEVSKPVAKIIAKFAS